MAAEAATPPTDVPSEPGRSPSPMGPAERSILNVPGTVVTYDNWIDDINRMLQYCRDYGIGIPPGLSSAIAGLKESIASAKSPGTDSSAATTSASTSAEGPDPVAPPADSPSPLALAMDVHGKLSALITPATPRSLEATEFPPRTWRAFITYGLVGFLIFAAFAGVIGYIATLPTVRPPVDVQPEKTPEESQPGEERDDAPRGKKRFGAAVLAQTAPALPEWSGDVLMYVARGLDRTQRNYFYAATLGAAFNGLFTAYRYLLSRSFDHGYAVVYIIRLVLGIVAGMILGNLGSGLFEGTTTFSKLGPGMIALLGGYSAEAVRQILDRLVEVMVSTVRGKGDAASAERLNVAKDVLGVVETATTDPNTPPEVREKLTALLRKLQK